ncbi:hypothetical protein ACQUWZ_26440, partial [Ralstonia pseudosolanacearum]|uniref:hypothetical protein n=1 Tax=Ralstonia pseudosolanacearum TaxID=1310165 RepID=UPI003D17D6CB
MKFKKSKEKAEAKLVEDIDKAFAINEKPEKSKKKLVFLICGIVAFLGGARCLVFAILSPGKVLSDLTFPTIPSEKAVKTDAVYSDLTGEELADASLKNSPIYCIQTPNG